MRRQINEKPVNEKSAYRRKGMLGVEDLSSQHWNLIIL
jgi:hypothetical protein